ncbi:MAG: AtpZ/AtpI family protein [Phycisphaeraceae bacterium]|nr:AtpZ/AtpI family protein [Phycisphaerales bacterium]MCB9860891.1 AtpZ/AtpI family protein [Phycisphaeraceae bacterium]
MNDDTPPSDRTRRTIPELPEVLRAPSAEEQQMITEHQQRERKRQDNSVSKTISDTGKVWSIAIDFGASVVAGVLIGFVFDYFLGTKPWGLITWAVLGLLSGFVRFIRQAMKANREQLAKMQGRKFRTVTSSDAYDDSPENEPSGAR